MIRRVCCVLLTTSALVLGASAAAALSYLPDAADLPKAVNEIDPDTTSDHIIREYVGGAANYSWDVFCPEEVGICPFGPDKVGTITLDFGAYKGRRNGDPAGANTVGGAAIRGGFQLADGVQLCDECPELRWLQTVRNTDGEGNTEEHVDGSPFYPVFGIDGIDADLYDVPYRMLTEDWRVVFESLLICVDCNEYLGSFLWGYEIAGGVVTPTAPQLWGAPTQSFLDTVEAAYPDLDISEGCCMIPEPSTLNLVLIGIIALAVRRVRLDRRPA